MNIGKQRRWKDIAVYPRCREVSTGGPGARDAAKMDFTKFQALQRGGVS